MAVGTVKWFNAQKRHGFIKPDDGSNSLFVQLSDAEQSALAICNRAGGSATRSSAASKAKCRRST